LDEYIPFVTGSEINDDPLSNFKICKRFTTQGDKRLFHGYTEDRFLKKLATPDVTVADLIGDIDPIKAANLKVVIC
jgi:magnesium chelatase subunit I